MKHTSDAIVFYGKQSSEREITDQPLQRGAHLFYPSSAISKNRTRVSLSLRPRKEVLLGAQKKNLS